MTIHCGCAGEGGCQLGAQHKPSKIDGGHTFQNVAEACQK